MDSKKQRILCLQDFTTIIYDNSICSSIYLPAPAWFENSDEFALILGSAPRIAVTGLISYLFGSLVNAKVLVKMRDKNRKTLWYSEQSFLHYLEKR